MAEDESVAMGRARATLIFTGKEISYPQRYIKRFTKTFLDKVFDFMWQQIVVGLALVVATTVLEIRRGIVITSQIHGSWLSVLQPYGFIILALILWHFARSGYIIYREDQSEIEQLKEHLSIFTPLQLDVLRLSKDLRDFLEQAGKRPQVDFAFYENKKDALIAQSDAVEPWLRRVLNGYAERSAPRVKAVRFRLGETGIEKPFRLDPYLDWATSERDIQQCQEYLSQMATELNNLR